MAENPSSWETLRLKTKLKPDEVEELRNQLRPILVTTEETEEDDVNLFLEFATTMISNQKSVAEAVRELVDMEMDLCPESASVKIGEALQSFIEQKSVNAGSDAAAAATETDISAPAHNASADNNTDRVVSLKSSKGNALTMSGALGASRNKKDDPQAKNNNNKSSAGNNQRERKGGDTSSNNKNNNNKKGRNEKKDSRDIRGEAFDRLSQDKGRGGGRGDRRNNHDRRDGRGRRNDNHRRDDRRDGGRGRRNRDEGDGPNRRRPREEDEYPNDEGRHHSPARGGGRGGGRSARGGRGDFDRDNKRQRMSENGHQEDRQEGGRGGYHDQSYDYDPHYQQQGYGGGRGRFGGRSFRGGRSGGRFHRGGRGRGFYQENFHNSQGGDEQQPQAENQEGGTVDKDTAEAAAVNPSPLVQNWRGGFRGGRGGRGFYRGGRSLGRGWNGARPDVKSMLASKTWVRKKDGESGGGDTGNSDNAPAPASAEG